MREEAAKLVVSRLRVYDDIAEQTFTVDVEDVVSLIDDPNRPGRYRTETIALVNSFILDRHPYVVDAGVEELAIDIEQFSDLKIHVSQQLGLRISVPSDRTRLNDRRKLH